MVILEAVVCRSTELHCIKLTGVSNISSTLIDINALSVNTLSLQIKAEHY